MAIHGIVFFIVGLILVIVSNIVEGLTIFIYVGYLFGIIGVAKLVLWFINRKESKTEAKNIDKLTGQGLQKPEVPSNRTVKYCTRCYSDLRLNYTYCPFCGNTRFFMR